MKFSIKQLYTEVWQRCQLRLLLQKIQLIWEYDNQFPFQCLFSFTKKRAILLWLWKGCRGAIIVLPFRTARCVDRQTTLKFMRRHVLFPVIRHSHRARDNNNCFLFASNNNNNDDNLTGYCAKNILQRVRIFSFSLCSALDFCQGDRSDGPPASPGQSLLVWLPGWLTDCLAGWIHWQL